MLRFMLGVCPYGFISSAMKLVEMFRVNMVFKRIDKTYGAHAHTHIHSPTRAPACIDASGAERMNLCEKGLSKPKCN